MYSLFHACYEVEFPGPAVDLPGTECDKAAEQQEGRAGANDSREGSHCMEFMPDIPPMPGMVDGIILSFK